MFKFQSRDQLHQSSGDNHTSEISTCYQVSGGIPCRQSGMAAEVFIMSHVNFDFTFQRSQVLGNKIEMQITEIVEQNFSLLRLGLHLEYNDARHRVAAHLQRNLDRSKWIQITEPTSHFYYIKQIFWRTKAAISDSAITLKLNFRSPCMQFSIVYLFCKYLSCLHSDHWKIFCKWAWSGVVWIQLILICNFSLNSSQGKVSRMGSKGCDSLMKICRLLAGP